MTLHKLLFGNKILSSKWVGFAVHKLSLLHGKFNSAVYNPNSNTRVTVRRVGKQEYITISVAGLLDYEFIAQDTIATPDAYHNIFGRVSAEFTGQAIDDFNILLSADHPSYPVPAAHFGNNVWHSGSTYVTAGIGRKYSNNALLFDDHTANKTLPYNAIDWPVNTHPYINNVADTVATPQAITGVTCMAAAILNGVLVCVDSFGTVTATLPTDGATVKSVPVTIPLYTGLSTSYWIFNKTGDVAVAVVDNIVQTSVDPDPVEYFGYTSVAKISFTAELIDDGSDFTVTATAETVYVNEVETDYYIDSFGADFYYDSDDIEYIVTMQEEYHSDDELSPTLLASNFKVIDAQTPSTVFARVHMKSVPVLPEQPIRTMLLDWDLRHLSFIALTGYGGTDKETLYLDGLKLRIYYNGELVDEQLTGSERSEIDYTLYTEFDVVRGVRLYEQLAHRSAAHITAEDGDVWSAYAMVPESPLTRLHPGYALSPDYTDLWGLTTPFPEADNPVVGFIETDIVSYGRGRVTHLDIYNIANNGYVYELPGEVLITPRPADWDSPPPDGFRIMTNSNWYVRT